MNPSKNVQEYIERHKNWKQELVLLRNALKSTELDECIKWGAPCYTLNGKNVIGFSAFKTHVGLWFHQGIFLSDTQNKLINAQEGTTKALRQWRFSALSEINPKELNFYIQEAIDNQKAGKKIKAVKAKSVEKPVELVNALKKDPQLRSTFSMLTPGRQREYFEYIGSAKQEKTRIARLEKCTPLILKGIGLNDKYKQ